jgi:hypothetical protein
VLEVGAYVRATHRLARNGSGGHGDRGEEHSVIAIDVWVRRVDDTWSEVADSLLDHPVDLHMSKRVEAHVGEVEMDVVGDPELYRSSHGLLLLACARIGVARVLRRRAVRQDDDAYLVATFGVDGTVPPIPSTSSSG